MAQGGVSVYFLATGSLNDAAETADVALLDHDERTRRNRLLFARDRRDFTAAHALVRRSLSIHGNLPPKEWRFEIASFGKPFLRAGDSRPPRLAFSLSHTRGLVACAVGEAIEIGVDVEPVDRRHRDLGTLAERFFSTTEVAGFRAQPVSQQRTRFIELWVLKEAYIKAVGVGLSQPLQSFAFEFVGPDGLRFTAPPGDSAASWQFALFAVAERYRLALAARRIDPCQPLAVAVHDAARPADSGRLLRASLEEYPAR